MPAPVPQNGGRDMLSGDSTTTEVKKTKGTKGDIYIYIKYMDTPPCPTCLVPSPQGNQYYCMSIACSLWHVLSEKCYDYTTKYICHHNLF